MSTIGVIYHDEDIHNIIKEPTPPILKPPMYVSKRKKLMPKEKTESTRKSVGHDREEDEQEPSRDDITKKKTEQKVPSANKKPGALQQSQKIATKWKIERPKDSRANYVKENIKQIRKLKPRIPSPRTVDSPRGTVKELRHLIEMIKIRERKEYGKVPRYLCIRKKQIEEYRERERKKKEIEKNYREKMGIGNKNMGENVYMIDKDTREKLLKGLKDHWAELSQQFLKLPVMSDTMTKIKRKIWLEQEIVRLEKDIKLVESHPFIYLERYDKRDTSDIAEELLREQEENERKAAEVKDEEVPHEPSEKGNDGEEELETHEYEKEK